MGINFFVGVTDPEWFSFHKKNHAQELNFWQPGGTSSFKAVSQGAPFIFKLRRPFNHISGIAFYVTHSLLPLSMAWRTFGEKNGFERFDQFKQRILSIRNDNEQDPVIGCLVLTDPIYFEEVDWIDMTNIWSPSIVQGKTYSTSEPSGQQLWQKISSLIEKYKFLERTDSKVNQLQVMEPAAEYTTVLSKVRLGQSGFRALVINAYDKRCAMTGERTLPALEAAHIKEYSQSGPHLVSNGLLLRADLHNLFDTGYITITEGLKIVVSGGIKSKFENGKEYYKLHGQELRVLPTLAANRPSEKYINWHNENVFER